MRLRLKITSITRITGCDEVEGIAYQPGSARTSTFRFPVVDPEWLGKFEPGRGYDLVIAPAPDPVGANIVEMKPAA